MTTLGIVTGAVIASAVLRSWLSRRHSRVSGWRGAVAAGLALAVALLLVGPNGVRAAIVPTVPLATADDYSVLGGQSVTNTGPSVLDQSVGVAPGTSITGFPPGIVNAPGTIEPNTPVAQAAQADLTTAYNNAAGRPLNATTTAELAGLTLVGGVYAGPDKSPLTLSGTLVLDGEGDPNSVFIFQTDSTLTTASASSVVLINGAQECNVFWQIGSSATLGSGSTFVGNILALTSITVNTGVTVQGRALARNGSVTLDTDVFNAPTCDVPTTTTTVGGGVTTTVGGGVTTTVGGGATTTVGGGVTTTVGGGGGPTTTVGGGGGPATTGPGVPSATIARTGSETSGSLIWAGLILALGVGITYISRRGSGRRPWDQADGR